MHLLPIPTAYYLLPTTYCLLPTTYYHQLPPTRYAEALKVFKADPDYGRKVEEYATRGGKGGSETAFLRPPSWLSSKLSSKKLEVGQKASSVALRRGKAAGSPSASPSTPPSSAPPPPPLAGSSAPPKKAAAEDMESLDPIASSPRPGPIAAGIDRHARGLFSRKKRDTSTDTSAEAEEMGTSEAGLSALQLAIRSGHRQV